MEILDIAQLLGEGGIRAKKKKNTLTPRELRFISTKGLYKGDIERTITMFGAHLHGMNEV